MAKIRFGKDSRIELYPCRKPASGTVLSMVHIVDEGSHFEIPIDKVWKLIEAHNTDGPAIHPDMKNMKGTAVDERTSHLDFDSDAGGQTVHTKLRITAFPPVGQALEVVEGPMKGSVMFNYYIPKGNRTAVTVVGEFKSHMMPDDQLKQAAWQFLEHEFNADTEYVKKGKI